MTKCHRHNLNRSLQPATRCAVLCVTGLGLIISSTEASSMQNRGDYGVTKKQMPEMRSLSRGVTNDPALTQRKRPETTGHELGAVSTLLTRSQKASGKGNMENHGLTGVRQSTASRLLTEALSNKRTFAPHNVQGQSAKSQGDDTLDTSRFTHLNTTHRTVVAGSSLTKGMAGTQRASATKRNVSLHEEIVKNTRTSSTPRDKVTRMQTSSDAGQRLGCSRAGENGMRRNSLRPSSTLLNRQTPSDAALGRPVSAKLTATRSTSVAPGGVDDTRYNIGKAEPGGKFKGRPKTAFRPQETKRRTSIGEGSGQISVARREQISRPFSAPRAKSGTRAPTSRDLNSNRTIEVPNMQFDKDKYYTHDQTSTYVPPHRFFCKSDSERRNNRENDRVQLLELSNYLNTPGFGDRRVETQKVRRERNNGRLYIDSKKNKIDGGGHSLVLDDALSTPVNSPVVGEKIAPSSSYKHEVLSFEAKSTLVISNREGNTADIRLWSDTSEADDDYKALMRNATANERTEFVAVSRVLGGKWKTILEMLNKGISMVQGHERDIRRQEKEMERMKTREADNVRQMKELNEKVEAIQDQSKAALRAIRDTYHFKPTEDSTSCYITENAKLKFQGPVVRDENNVVPRGAGTLTFDVDGTKVNVCCEMYGGCLSVRNDLKVTVGDLTLNIRGDPEGRACDLVDYKNKISDLNNVTVGDDASVLLSCNEFRVLFKNDYMFIGNTANAFSDVPKDGFLLTGGRTCTLKNGVPVQDIDSSSSSETSSMYDVD